MPHVNQIEFHPFQQVLKLQQSFFFSQLFQYRIYLGGYYSTSSAIVPLSSAIVPPFLPKSWIFGDVKISKIKKYKMQSGSERIFQKFLL